MNWQKYKFFSVYSAKYDDYDHYFWVDGEVFVNTYPIHSKMKFAKIIDGPNNLRYYEIVSIFLLEEECRNYINSVKYYNILDISDLSDKLYASSEYIKKIMNRENNLEKILNII